MPDNSSPDDRLIKVARGCGHCVGALAGGDADEWAHITHDDLSQEAVDRLLDDCAAFLARADELHPEGKEGFAAFRTLHSIGWFFGLARMGAPSDFALIVPSPFGRELNALAASFDRITVGLNDDEEIVFVDPPARTPGTSL